jgi:O-antigen/teichoic acid export membrane protein
VILLWILAVRTLGVGLPLGLYRSALYGEQRIALVNLVQVGFTLVYAAAAFVVLEAGEGLVGFAWVGLGSFVLEHVVYAGAAYGLIRRLRVSPLLADRGRLAETLSVSVYQFLVNVAALVLLRTDPILVNAFLPLSSVASYGVALRVAENAILLLKQGINVLGPPIAEMHGRGEHAKIRQVLVSGAKFAFAPGVVLTAAVWIFASDAITFWVGDGFEEAAPVLVVLMTAMTLSVPQAVASSVFTMTGNHRVTALVSVSSMAVHIAIGLVLVQFFDLVGLALGTLTASVIVDNGFMIALARKYHGVGYREFARRIFAPAVWPGVVQAAVTLGIRLVAPPESLVEVALEALPGMAVYAVLFWRFGVEEEERSIILRKVLGRG